MTVIQVSPEEHDLLSVTRAVFGQLPAAAVRPLLGRDGRLKPAGLGGKALRGLERSLAVGSVWALMQRGGWRHETSFSGDRVATGRLWERRPPPTLSFTATSYDTLWRLLGAEITPAAPRSDGDELVIYLACDLWRRAGRDLAAWRDWIPSTVVARLAFPDAAGDGPAPAWLDRELLLDALQHDLATQLLRIDALLRELPDAATLQGVAERHERDLTSLLEACISADRLDLLTFLVDATARIVTSPPRRALPEPTPGSLRQRSEALAASAAIYRAAAVLEREYHRLRHIGFLDDGYEQAQQLLRRWERFAASGFAAAAAHLGSLTALDAGVQQQ